MRKWVALMIGISLFFACLVTTSCQSRPSDRSSSIGGTWVDSFEDFDRLSHDDSKVYFDAYTPHYQRMQAAVNRGDLHYKLVGGMFYKHRTKNYVVANVYIGFLGIFEVVFSNTSPPTVRDSYYLDTKRKIRYQKFSALQQAPSF